MKHLFSILPSRCVSSVTGYEVKTKGPGDHGRARSSLEFERCGCSVTASPDAVAAHTAERTRPHRHGHAAPGRLASGFRPTLRVASASSTKRTSATRTVKRGPASSQRLLSCLGLCSPRGPFLGALPHKLGTVGSCPRSNIYFAGGQLFARPTPRAPYSGHR
jgi:hypothetical protein